MNWHLTLAIVGTIILVVLATAAPFILSALLSRRNARHDPRDDIAQGDDIYLARQVRRAIHPEACAEEWPYLPEDRSRGLLAADHGGER